MSVIRGLGSADLPSVVLTIGNFDGVHRGHQAILSAGRRRADAAGTLLVAMTFEPHPCAILTPDRVPPALMPLDEKLRGLERAGADVVVVVATSPAFLHLSADDFTRDVILGRFKPFAVVEGSSFGFGRHRQGNVDTLRAAGRVHGFDVEVVEPVRVAVGGQPGAVISSSLIRHLLSSGTVDQAGLCLGRPYVLLGTVTRGSGRGRDLGFPTANLGVAGQLVPAEGVYAARAEVAGRSWAAAVSIGRNPTFQGRALCIEAHLLDFEGDLYGAAIRLEFLHWVRPQQKFDSSEALARQIARDLSEIRGRVGG